MKQKDLIGRQTMPLWRPELEHDACGIALVAQLGGKSSRRIVEDALGALERMTHRGASGADPETGDGAGILLQIPDLFLRQQLDFALPESGRYAVAQIFYNREVARRHSGASVIEKHAKEMGFSLLGTREVPVDPHACGAQARLSMPRVEQLFITHDQLQGDALERALYVLRRRVENDLDANGNTQACYIASLSSRTIVYKGMLRPPQLRLFYADLRQKQLESAFAMVHSRFSTNTFPSWDKAQPSRCLAHNGEINTLRGAQSAIAAAQQFFNGGELAADMKRILPVIDTREGSDSMKLDNTLEFLVHAGRPIEQALMLLQQGAWSELSGQTDAMRAFYEYAECLTTPWDGPAAVVFTDGLRVGAALDRNGLRPARWMLSDSGVLVLASESGVVDIPAAHIVRRGKLGPGQMLLADIQRGVIEEDAQVKARVSDQPYAQWLSENRQHAQRLDAPAIPVEDVQRMQRLFGYSYEDLTTVIAPMATNGAEATGSMGYDSPLAVLSEKPQPLYHYFKQLFAQVTNPPIDALRETCVTGTTMHLGRNGDLTLDQKQNCHRICLEHPILDNQTFQWLLKGDHGAKVARLSICFDPQKGLKAGLDALLVQADEAIAKGCELLVLSDRAADATHVPIPALLAASGLHHHLIRAGKRGVCSLIVDTFDAREIHHFCCLLGYGVRGIHPYGALRSIDQMVENGIIQGVSLAQAHDNYVHAAAHGLLKVASKMGISSLSGYFAAQVFEAVGLSQDVVDEYFTGTVSRFGGMGMEDIQRECLARHQAGMDLTPGLPSGGRFQWKRDGEEHAYHPQVIHLLQTAVRNNDYALYKEYVAQLEAQPAVTLRALLGFKATTPVPIEEVEPVVNILKRFKSGAMSFGSLSEEAHTCLAEAMNRIGGRSNSGEGGEDAKRFNTEYNSRIKQVASGRFGVTGPYLASGDEIQIKMAQGAKPGEGGQLPAGKVYPVVARVRNSTPGVGLISPPPHHDIYSIEDLAQLIYDLKCSNPRARINVKLVSETGVGTVAAGVAKSGADVILISGFDGGTGASPRTSIQHAGLPWEIGLSEAHQILGQNGLRSRVRVETDGKLMTGRDVAIAALLGAEEFGFATLPLVAMGCVMMRVCNLDTCPVGVATQNPQLRKLFAGKAEHVVNALTFIARDLREVMAQLGFRTIDEMVGRAGVLTQVRQSAKTQGLDVSALCVDVPMEPRDAGMPQVDDGLFEAMVRTMVETGDVQLKRTIRNTDRAMGTKVGAFISREFGNLPEDHLTFRFVGTAGQSFGAFIPRGMTLWLKGDVNDYLGKGLSGGRLIIAPPDDAAWSHADSYLAGNVVLYGATSGELFLAGRAGERFGVRNSGALAVCEGVGDHGCEYMTGGKVVILGSVGKNFAAGMSGGVAYVLDDGTLEGKINHEMVKTYPIDASDVVEVHAMIRRHHEYTHSVVAGHVLHEWANLAQKFVKVLPNDYQAMLQAMQTAEKEGLTGDDQIDRAFQIRTGGGVA